MSQSATEITLLRIPISDSVWRTGNIINWEARDANQARHLKDLKILVSRLQRHAGENVALQAIERTNGDLVEFLITAKFEHPELPLGASEAENFLEIFHSALTTLKSLEASPLPAELIAISPGDPADSSEIEVRAPKQAAELAALLRTHLPEAGAEFLPDSSGPTYIIPKRGVSATLQDEQEVLLAGEICGVLDRRRTVLLQGEEGAIELSLPPTGGVRERLLEAQQQHATVELRAHPSYRMVNGVRKISGGSLLGIVKIIDNPTQTELLD